MFNKISKQYCNKKDKINISDERDSPVHAQKGGAQGRKQENLLNKSEQLLVQMAKTMELINQQNKKLSNVTDTVSNLEREIKTLKRPRGGEGTEENRENKKQRKDQETEQSDQAMTITSNDDNNQSDTSSVEIGDDCIRDAGWYWYAPQFGEWRKLRGRGPFSESDNFFEEQGQTGDKVSDKLASVVNRNLWNPVDDNKLKELKKTTISGLKMLKIFKSLPLTISYGDSSQGISVPLMEYS